MRKEIRQFLPRLRQSSGAHSRAVVVTLQVHHKGCPLLPVRNRLQSVSHILAVRSQRFRRRELGVTDATRQLVLLCFFQLCLALFAPLTRRHLCESSINKHGLRLHVRRAAGSMPAGALREVAQVTLVSKGAQSVFLGIRIDVGHGPLR